MYHDIPEPTWPSSELPQHTQTSPCPPLKPSRIRNKHKISKMYISICGKTYNLLSYESSASFLSSLIVTWYMDLFPIHFCWKYQPSNYSVLGTVPGAWNTKMSKINVAFIFGAWNPALDTDTEAGTCKIMLGKLTVLWEHSRRDSNRRGLPGERDTWAGWGRGSR